MTFDPETLTYYNAPVGREITLPLICPSSFLKCILIFIQGVLINATSDFGGFGAMAYLDPTLMSLLPYMEPFVQYFQGVSFYSPCNNISLDILYFRLT